MEAPNPTSKLSSLSLLDLAGGQQYRQKLAQKLLAPCFELSLQAGEKQMEDSDNQQALELQGDTSQQ